MAQGAVHAVNVLVSEDPGRRSGGVRMGEGELDQKVVTDSAPETECLIHILTLVLGQVTNLCKFQGPHL